MRPGVELFIALIEGRPFERERIRHSLQSALSLRVVTYSTTSELEHHFRDTTPQVVVLSVSEVGEASAALRLLSELVPNAPVIVLAQTDDDVNLARTVMRHGAKGFIPYTMDFTIAVEAVRFVLAAPSR
jgi:DNA-binding NarL/FixJ family response regulator